MSAARAPSASGSMKPPEPENASANPLPCSPPVITVVSDATVPGDQQNCPSELAMPSSAAAVSNAPAATNPVGQVSISRPTASARDVGEESAVSSKNRSTCATSGLRRQAGEERIRRRDLGHLLRARGRLPSAALAEVVGGRHAGPVVENDPYAQPGVLAERRLVDHGVREPREPAPLVRVEHLHAVDPAELERRGRDCPEPVLADQARHQRTPTWTSRKRAGDVPWPTRPT